MYPQQKNAAQTKVIFVNGINYTQGDRYPINFVSSLQALGYDASWAPAYGNGAVADAGDFTAEIGAYQLYKDQLAGNAYCAQMSAGTRGFSCPTDSTFHGGPYSSKLAEQIAANPPSGDLRLIGYSGGGSVVLNTALLLLDKGIKVKSIDLFGAPADPNLVKALQSKGVDIQFHAEPGDTTAGRPNAVAAGGGLAYQALFNGSPHSDYFRKDLINTVDGITQEWGRTQ